MSPDLLEMADKESLQRLTLPLPFRIGVTGSELFFEIDSFRTTIGTHLYDARFFPGEHGAAPSNKTDDSWGPIAIEFKRWAQRVRVELSEPDPWLLVEQGGMLLGNIPTEAYTDRLSEHDLHLVHEFVGRITEFLIAEVAPSEQQLALINERLGHLEKAAKTQDKKAFAYTAVGVVVAIATSLTLSPEVGHKLFALTSELLKTIFMKLLS